jgi:hypothetical protein
MKASMLFRKHAALLCWLLCTGWSFVMPTHALAQQETTAMLQQIERALAGGDVRGVLESAGDRVEIVLFGEGMRYSRAQAVYVMESFFQHYPPQAFTFQEPSTNARSCFATGVYRHRRGAEHLKVYVRLWHREKQWELREIRIDQRTRE